MLGTFGLAKEYAVDSPRALAQSYGPWVGFRTNHVIGPNAEFKDPTGSSRGISNKNDLALMHAIREFADLLLVDAKTARDEGYRGSKQLPLALVSKSGNFHGIKALENPNASVILFATDFNFDADQQALITKVQIKEENPIGEIDFWCKANGHLSVLIEAGPTLAKLAVDSQLVSQSAITQTGLVDSSNHKPINPFGEGCELLSLAIEPATQYSLWKY